ncbi:DapH/DapD/GlmU-related protein [Microvirga solisilvae]|uniref:DapH/DapD/GlmU-related protein n=1 Tax=Microvirga solisilvae TaxID=2919498 RepID=UPI001FAEFB11|nr:DapH/DapD/GlmU-related protein [Microvirga solisilvae]
MSQASYSIIGRGGLFQPIREILTDHIFRGYYDDRATDDPTWLGAVAQYKDSDESGIFVAIAALRNMSLRRRLIQDLKQRNLLSLNAVSKDASVATSVKMGVGNIICPNTCLHSKVTLGSGCIVFSNTAIEHDSVLGDNVNIAPGVTIAGGVRVDDDCYLGAGSVLIDGVVVGSGSVVGAGSVVLKSVPAGVIVYGNPAKIIRSNDLYLEPTIR